MADQLGPYPYSLCDKCRKTNGGLRYTRHRQVHLASGDREACIDQGLAGLMPLLWQVCTTYGCCEDDGGRAYVNPSADTADAAEAMLTGLGLPVERTVGGSLYFTLPPAQQPGSGNAGGTARDLVATAAAGLARHTAGIDHASVAAARDELAKAAAEIQEAAVRRASVMPRSSGRLLCYVLAQVLSCWAFAWIASQVAGTSALRVIVGGVIGYAVARVIFVRLIRRGLRIAGVHCLSAWNAGAERAPAVLGNGRGRDGDFEAALPGCRGGRAKRGHRMRRGCSGRVRRCSGSMTRSRGTTISARGY